MLPRKKELETIFCVQTFYEPLLDAGFYQAYIL